MIVLSPSLLIAVANSYVGLGEDGGDNRGQMVEFFLREVKQPPGEPWCAAFVYHVGYWSHWDHRSQRSTWPLPATASCWVLGDYARKRGALYRAPQLGDVFLKWHRQFRRYAHTGIVIEVLGAQRGTADDTVYTCMTVEGNTNTDGSREGRLTLRKERRFTVPREGATGDRFIRWAELDTRARAA